MRRPRLLRSLASVWLLGLWLGAAVSTVAAQQWEPYLDGYRGPYRGRVIDAETKEPIGGAVVVAVWGVMKEELSHAIMIFYEAREAITDDNGDFLLYAEEIEKSAPPQTLRPTFVIFYPGYGPFPSHHVVPQGFVGGIFEGSGSTVELPRLQTPAERLAVLGGLPPVVPQEKIPNLLRLIDIEQVNLKLKPPEQGSPG